MLLSDAGLQILTKLEGFSPTIYDDGAGFLTIGYGHKLLESEIRSNRFANGITETEAREILRQDVGFAESAVSRSVRVALAQHQYDALVSFVFNIGAYNFNRSTLLRVLNAGNYEDVPYQLSRWVYAGGQKLRGLIRRREVEGEMWRGRYPAVIY